MPRFASTEMVTAAGLIKSAEADLKEARKLVRERYEALEITHMKHFASDEMLALESVHYQTGHGLERVKDAYSALGDWS